MDPNKIAEIFADERAMERLVNSIHRIDTAVTALASRTEVLGTRTVETIDRTVEGLEKATAGAEDLRDDVRDMIDIMDLATPRIDNFAQKIKGIFASLNIGSVVEGFERITNVMAKLQTSPESTIMQGVRSIPVVGNMLEVMMRSQMQQDIAQTAGRRAMLGFQQGSNQSPEQITRQGAEIGDSMLSLERRFLATREEVQAVFGAMVQGGMKATDAVKQANFAVAGFGSTVVEVSLGVDKALQVAAGSTMQFATQITQGTGMQIDKSVALVKDLGGAAQATGLTFQQMVGSITQVTSALRVQGGDAQGLANAYFNIQAAIKGSMATDTSEQRVSDLSSAALGGVGQFVGGMNDGLKGFLGQGIAQRLGLGNMSALQALRGMETGFQMQGRQGDFARASSEEAFSRLAPQAGGDDTKLFFLLTKVANMPALLAEAMIKTQGGLFGSDDKFQKAKADMEAKLAQAETVQPLNIGTFEKTMKSLSEGVNAIGNLINTTLASILRVLLGLGEAMLTKNMKGFQYLSNEVASDMENAMSQIETTGGQGLKNAGGFFNAKLGIHRNKQGDLSVLPDEDSVGAARTRLNEVERAGAEAYMAAKLGQGKSLDVYKRFTQLGYSPKEAGRGLVDVGRFSEKDEQEFEQVLDKELLKVKVTIQRSQPNKSTPSTATP